jgi:hypothetical protein
MAEGIQEATQKNKTITHAPVAAIVKASPPKGARLGNRHTYLPELDTLSPGMGGIRGGFSGA